MILEKEACTIERRINVCTAKIHTWKEYRDREHPESSKRKTTKLCLEEMIFF